MHVRFKNYLPTGKLDPNSACNIPNQLGIVHIDVKKQNNNKQEPIPKRHATQNANGYHNVKSTRSFQRLLKCNSLSLLEPRTLQNPPRSESRLGMCSSLELPDIHQFAPAVKSYCNRSPLLKQQQFPLFPSLFHDNRPSSPDFGHTLSSQRPGTLPH